MTRSDCFKRILTYAPGSSFGELSLIQGQPRRAAATARNDLIIAILRKDDYLETAGIEEKKKIDSINSMYRNLPFIKEIFENRESEEFFKKLYYSFEEKSYGLGSVIYREGDPHNFFFVIRSGQVKLYKDLVVKKSSDSFLRDNTKTFSKPVTILCKDDLCGEYEMLFLTNYVFTAVVDSERAQIFQLPKEKFYTTLFRSREYIETAKVLAERKYQRLLDMWAQNSAIYRDTDPRTSGPQNYSLISARNNSVTYDEFKQAVHPENATGDPLQMLSKVNGKLTELNEKLQKK